MFIILLNSNLSFLSPYACTDSVVNAKILCTGTCILQGRAEGVLGNLLKFPVNENLKNRNTLIEHSNNLLKQSSALIVPCHH